ncbi:MAG: ribosome small subunit-dependent GTPase A [Pseudomonadota bacterium]
MARRRLSERQRSRIRKNQDQQSDNSAHQPALVISHRGSLLRVELLSGETVEAKIKSNLGNIICGDQVTVETTPQNEQRVIAVTARSSLLQRKDGYGSTRPVAANISQLVICLSMRPEPNLYMLDEYLHCAEQQKINACILLNKIDLADINTDPFDLQKVYQPLGYSILHTSVKNGFGMENLIQILSGQISVISGVSGVGKSSITRYLLPEEDIRIGEISESNDEGKHTTRSSHLYHLSNGGDLIDTPGIRGFDPVIDEDRPVDTGFREIYTQAANCRFHNCMHTHEPKCAVIKAVSNGDIAGSRYQSYLKLLDQTRNS